MVDLVGIVGCGWLGRALGRALVASGVRVIGTTTSERNARELAKLGIEPVTLVFAPEARGDSTKLSDVDAIVVAVPPARELDPVEQSRFVARVVSGTRAKHLVQISSTSVYRPAGGRVRESDATPEHELRRVERSYEELGCVVTVLRCAGLFGPGRLILPFVLRSGMAVDEGTPVNLVEQSDVVAAIRRVLDEPAAGVFNVCADEHPSKGEFYRAIAERAGLGLPRFREGAAGDRIVDNEKLKRRFDFEYRYPNPLEFPVP